MTESYSEEIKSSFSKFVRQLDGLLESSEEKARVSASPQQDGTVILEVWKSGMPSLIANRREQMQSLQNQLQAAGFEDIFPQSLENSNHESGLKIVVPDTMDTIKKISAAHRELAVGLATTAVAAGLEKARLALAGLGETEAPLALTAVLNNSGLSVNQKKMG